MADPITGMVTIVVGGVRLALDNMGNQYAAPLLKPPSNSASQTWVYYPDSQQLQATSFPNVNNGWVGLRSDNLQIDLEWNNDTMYWAFVGGTFKSASTNEYLVPTADGSSVMLGATPGAPWTLGDTQVGPTPSPYVPAGYVLVFNDEFDGVEVAGVATKQVDTSKWVFRYSYSGGTLDFLDGNFEQERYREGDGQSGKPNHIITPEGSVQLTAYPANPDGTYDSGMLRSKVYFDLSSLTAGTYFEARIKSCAGIGSWPAFWLSGTANADGGLQWPPEIDISERSMNDSISPPTINWDSGQHVVHLGPQTNGLVPGPWNNVAAAWQTPLPANGYTWNAPTAELYVGTPWDITAGFHVYGLLVTPGAAGQYINPLTGEPTHQVQYFMDGQLCLTHVYDSQFWPDGTNCRGMDLLFDLAIGGRMGGNPNFSAPIAEEIDYVRVYTAPGGPTPQPAANLVDYPCPATGY